MTVNPAVRNDAAVPPVLNISTLYVFCKNVQKSIIFVLSNTDTNIRLIDTKSC